MKQSALERVRTSLRGALLLLVVGIVFWIGGLQAGVTAAHAVTHISAAAAGCPAGKYCAYLPAVTAPIRGDLVLKAIEVTQAVQNTQNSIHLVAGKVTVLRIYANTAELNKAVSNVKIAIKASTTGNIYLSGSPKTFYATVPTSSSRADYQSTINIALPSTWLSGTVNLAITIDPDNAIRESDENNNSITQTLVFNAVPPLRITVVPVRFHNTRDGRTYPAPGQDMISDWILRTYPINKIEVSWHAPYDFSGDMTQSADWSKLLGEITTIKSTEGAPSSQVYYGLIPTTDGTNTWFYGGMAGLGWVGSRAAIGLDYENQTSQLAAHEIGHNLGMWHTPCGGAASPEPDYPYPDGSIGQYGLDVISGVVYGPSTKDVMSYCSPKWVSDYTYAKLFTGQVQAGASAAMTLTAADPGMGASQRGLLVRANITADGVELLPAYILPGRVSAAPEAGEYRVEVLGEQGEILAQAPVRAYQAVEDGGIQITSINAMIALPIQAATRLRLLRDGQVLAEQALQTATTRREPAVVDGAGSAVRLRWNPAQIGAQPAPGLVRYTTDGGKTWTTVGVDVGGGELSLPAGAPPEAAYEVISAANWK